MGLADLHVLTGSDDPTWRERSLWAAVKERGEFLSADGVARLERLWPVMEAAEQQRGRLSTAEWVERTWRTLGGDAYLTAEEMENARRYLQLLDAMEEESRRIDLRQLEQRMNRLYAESPVRRRRGRTGDDPQGKRIGVGCSDGPRAGAAGAGRYAIAVDVGGDGLCGRGRGTCHARSDRGERRRVPRAECVAEGNEEGTQGGRAETAVLRGVHAGAGGASSVRRAGDEEGRRHQPEIRKSAGCSVACGEESLRGVWLGAEERGEDVGDVGGSTS